MTQQPDGRTLELLETLVGFDTTSRNSNLALIEFVRDHLEGLGADCRVVPSEDRQKANLYATIGPRDRGGVMLSGHSDVVPVDGQNWSTDPFTVVERDGRFYGRGTCDMKGFIACVLAAAPAFAAADLSEPLHIAVTYDEEVGCQGVPGLIDAIRDLSVQPRLCIVGEPTEMNVAIGHKGSRAYHARFHGREAHSSLAPTTVNAVEYAADLVVRLRELGRRFAEGGPFDNDYDVTHTTVHSGVIHGGRQVNIVPALCELDFEFRPLPEQDDDAVEAEIRQWVDGELAPEMTAVQPGCGIDLQRRYAYPGLSTAPEEDIVAFAGELSGRTIPIKVAFGTEAGAFRNGLGIPAVVCGPGSIRQAHQPDEFISAEQLAACDAFMLRLLDRMKTS